MLVLRWVLLSVEPFIAFLFKDMLLTGQLIKEGYLKTPRLISAWRKIERQDFLPAELVDSAETNAPLPIGHGQTISQPLTVAFMLELLAADKGMKVLDVGSGSGWQTALLAELVGEIGTVHALEVIPELKGFGEKNVSKYNFIKSKRVKFFCTDGWEGYTKAAPYDRIIVAAAGESIPQPLIEQLKDKGRLVMPVGGRWSQDIVLLIKEKGGKISEKRFPGFVFVPLVKLQENK